MYPKYITLAHLPIDISDEAFRGEFALLPCEWQIHDGVHGKARAEATAKKWRKYFREVQIRQVTEEI